MGRGRRTDGPELVSRLEGSDQAKERLALIMQTLTGDLSVDEACTKLGIGLTAFSEMRRKALESALSGLEPGQPGRPAHVETHTTEEVHKLKSQITELRLDLEAARLREEIALIMPDVLESRHKGSKKKR
jgi:transposase-like protein